MSAKKTTTTAKSKAAKAGTKKKAGARKSSGGAGVHATGDGVQVRMYNVGFGDCFLLTFNTSAGPRRVLIDCGYHISGPPPVAIKDVVTEILADITSAGKARIDVVIATHRHRDHVYGFEDKRWNDVEVGEVWMPWTEDEKDPDAARIREAQAAKAKRLTLAINELKRIGRISDDQHATALNVVKNSDLTNSTAMDMLHSGFKGAPTRRFIPEKPKRAAATSQWVREIATDLLPGVKVHILGPSRDDKVIRDMNPPGDESFLHLVDGEDGGGAITPFPLDGWTFLSGDKAGRDWMKKALASQDPLDPDTPPTDPEDFKTWWFRGLDLKLGEISSWEADVEDDAFAAAVALEQAVNGTSLFLVFEVGKEFLAFPGDAQWGTWNAALQDTEWRALLKRTTFYKVGHHGSHNATPVQFVNDVLVDQRFVAMVSTRNTAKFDDIPRKPLLAALTKKAIGLARSDQKAKSPFTLPGNLRTDYAG